MKGRREGGGSRKGREEEGKGGIGEDERGGELGRKEKKRGKRE